MVTRVVAPKVVPVALHPALTMVLFAKHEPEILFRPLFSRSLKLRRIVRERYEITVS